MKSARKERHLHILVKCPGDMQIMNAKGHLGPPLVLYSRPPFKLDLETHSPTPQGYRVFGVHPPDSPSGLGLSHLTGKVGLW